MVLDIFLKETEKVNLLELKNVESAASRLGYLLTDGIKWSKLEASERSSRGGNGMVKITEIVRESRNGGCPAVHAVEGDLRLARGETVSAGMALLQAYLLDDPDAIAQISFDPGEGVLAVPESLILKAAGEIRARNELR